jgi:uracil-DNA glycosylase family 4
MTESDHPALELAEIVADLRQLGQAWWGVGARQLPWDPVGPDWPQVEHAPDDARADGLEPSSVVARRPEGPRPSDPRPAADARGPGAPSLFPQAAQPRPKPLPPKPATPEQVGRWQGFGRREDPAAAMAKLRDKLGNCERCPLHRGRSNIVFGVGDPRARLVVVGEAPGFHEDQQAEPFVGPAGQMLDRMLVNVLSLKREQVYIMNVLKCRPPDNRDPEPPEVQACRPFFDAQLNIIRPRAILALGRFATQSLLDTPQGIMGLRGRWGSYRKIPVMPTFHPAYLLRKPQDKRLTLQDLLALKERLEE